MVMVRHDAKCEHFEVMYSGHVFKSSHQFRDVFFGLKDILSIVSPHNDMKIGIRMPVSFSPWDLNDPLSSGIGVIGRGGVSSLLLLVLLSQ